MLSPSPANARAKQVGAPPPSPPSPPAPPSPPPPPDPLDVPLDVDVDALEVDALVDALDVLDALVEVLVAALELLAALAAAAVVVAALSSSEHAPKPTESASART